MKKLEAVVNNHLENHILPFFWQHHEKEQTLRTYMQVIENANIKAVCVESRPHPDFAGPGWWQDMDVILEEAQRRNMQVWILDDSHFPSGYANGALKGKYPELHRQFVVYQPLVKGVLGVLHLPQDAWLPPAFVKNPAERFMMEEVEEFPDDECMGFVAICEDGSFQVVHEGDRLASTSDVYGLYKTRNRGPHRDYINMLDANAVQKFLDTVYEPHYAHYEKYFGNVIAGFFSDEPEIGNDHLYGTGKQLHELEDIPWSSEAEDQLSILWGEKLLENLLRIFLGLEKKCVLCRIQYMDVVTRLVEKNFSCQIGNWCRSRNVDYIGHLIEDHNQHTRTGSSLGHYFRGLKGQSWAGIDVIGGQVIPQTEDAIIISNFSKTQRDGTFFQFTLGKLGSSAAAIDPLKKGRAMCELFGAYGWEEGVALEKYLLDHVMVRGINRFVPHAFSPKAFPDPDCPPHFYAHGNNPQYRHFGELMLYANRVSNLLSGGHALRRAAVLYHGEADWSGLPYQKEDGVVRLLTEQHLDFDIIPSDVFTDESYETHIENGKLIIGLGCYDAVILPSYPVIRDTVAQKLNAFAAAGGRVLCVDRLPEITIDGNTKLDARLVSMETLFEQIQDLTEISFTGDSHYLRYLHYQNQYDVFYVVNESDSVYEGTVTLPGLHNPVVYDAWSNRVHPLAYMEQSNTIQAKLRLEPRKSWIIYADGSSYAAEASLEEKIGACKKRIELISFQRDICKGIDYPNFTDCKMVSIPDCVEADYPRFGGFIRYRTTVELESKEAYLELYGMLEGVEVFVNGKSLGIQVVPTYRFDLTGALQQGENEIVIVVATTLERFVEKKSHMPNAPLPEPKNLLGIRFPVCLYLP